MFVAVKNGNDFSLLIIDSFFHNVEKAFETIMRAFQE